jgi:integrase
MKVLDYVTTYQLKTGIRKGSVYQYTATAKCMDSWAGKPVELAELSADWFNRWLRDISETLAPATVACRKRHGLALWRSAHDDGLAETCRGRLIRRVVAPRRHATAWTPEEVRSLLAVAGELEGFYDFAGQKRADLWQMLIRCAWDTGLRQGDLLAASPGDFNHLGCAVVSQSKTSRDVLVKLSKGTMQQLATTNWRGRTKLCPWPYTLEHFRAEFTWIVLAAGLTGTFKKLRKSSATDVEKHHPGWGAIHLGHGSAFKVADQHYFDWTIIMREKPMPTEL